MNAACLITWRGGMPQWEQGFPYPSEVHLYTQQLPGQPPSSGSPGQMVDLTGVVYTKEIIRHQTLWQLGKSGQIWFKSIRHNMEMALISFFPSRKRLGILQRLESYWPMPSLTIKKQHGWSLSSQRNGKLGCKKHLALKGHLQSRKICLWFSKLND